MKITLLGVLVAVAIAALLVYAGYELRRSEEKRPPFPNPNPPLKP